MCKNDRPLHTNSQRARGGRGTEGKRGKKSQRGKENEKENKRKRKMEMRGREKKGTEEAWENIRDGKSQE